MGIESVLVFGGGAEIPTELGRVTYALDEGLPEVGVISVADENMLDDAGGTA